MKWKILCIRITAYKVLWKKGRSSRNYSNEGERQKEREGERLKK